MVEKSKKKGHPKWMSFCFGGDKRDRTADLLNAIQALSQLSYTPICSCILFGTKIMIADGGKKVKRDLKKYLEKESPQRLMESKAFSMSRTVRFTKRRIFRSLALARIPMQVPAAIPMAMPVQKLQQHMAGPPFGEIVSWRRV